MPLERPESSRPLDLAVVIPTFNEVENVLPLLERLEEALASLQWEAIFVDDDSPDHTASLVSELGRSDRRIRVIRRIGRQGLASACVEGMLATSAPYIAVMDADLQHDESILLTMYERIKSEQLDLVIGSRNIEGGGMGEMARPRAALSGLGSRLSRAVSKCELSDPMSGFFIVNRKFLEEVIYRLSATGFKILVDLVASAQRPVRFAEVPYRFRNRQRGVSKLDMNVGLEYLQLLLDKLIGGILPARFVMFGLVGGMGLLVHLAVLALLYWYARYEFLYAQAVATVAAMTFNFLINNLTTFRDRRLRGFLLVKGLAIYYLACSIGAITNLSFARFLLGAGLPWYLAGILGMAVSSVWNYGVNAIFTWRRVTRQLQQRGTSVERSQQAVQRLAGRAKSAVD